MVARDRRHAGLQQGARHPRCRRRSPGRELPRL